MGLMPIQAGPKSWAQRALSFVRASGCNASIWPPVWPLGVVNVDNQDGRTLRVSENRVLAALELVAIGSIIFRACLAGFGVFNPRVFEVAVSAGVHIILVLVGGCFLAWADFWILSSWLLVLLRLGAVLLRCVLLS